MYLVDPQATFCSQTMAPLGSSKSPGATYTPMRTSEIRSYQMMETQEEPEDRSLHSIEEGEPEESQSLFSDEMGTERSAFSRESKSGFSQPGTATVTMSVLESRLSSSDEEDESTIDARSYSRDARDAKRGRIRKGVASGLLLALTLSVVVWCGFEFGPTVTGTAEAPGATKSSPGIIGNPEFRVLLANEIRPLLQGHNEDQIKMGVNTTLNRLDNIVVKNLPKEQREILEKQEVEAQTWADFAALAKAMRDPRVQRLGKEAFQVIRNSSIFDGPAVLSAKIIKHITDTGRVAEMQSLREELIPKGFTSALDRWAKENLANGGASDDSDAAHSKAWRGMLDPSITKLMRGNGTIEIDYEYEGRRLDDKGRQLNMGTWAHPVLNGFETTLGITTVVLVTAMELVIHIEIINPKFHMPTWAWLLVFMPAQTVAVWTCVTGLSLWCDLVFGALGLNVLDALFLIMRMR